MELKFVCEKRECQEYFATSWRIDSIKKSRHLSTSYFDLYDLDRPRTFHHKTGDVIDYERVCRICGGPLKNKDGKYSSYRRYCSNCNKDALWRKYNWGATKWDYANEIQEVQAVQIETIKEKYPERIHDYLVLCELCGNPCIIYQYKIPTLSVINIHHKVPVHTLDLKSLHLIWDFSNLIALCPECHNKQDHQLSKLKMAEISQFRKITEYFEVCRD